jgi:hypothetical protein
MIWIFGIGSAVFCLMTAFTTMVFSNRDGVESNFSVLMAILFITMSMFAGWSVDQWHKKQVELEQLQRTCVDQWHKKQVELEQLQRTCVQLGVATTTKMIVAKEEFHFLPEAFVPQTPANINDNGSGDEQANDKEE